MRNSKSYYGRQHLQQEQQGLPHKNCRREISKDLFSFEKTVNQLILKSDILQKETKRLSKIIKNTQLQVQKLQQQNKQLKNRLKDIEQYNSKKSMTYTDHEQFTGEPSMPHYMSQQRISYVETCQDQFNQQISLLDGIQQNNCLQYQNTKIQKQKLKLDFSTIKKANNFKEGYITKQKQKKYTQIEVKLPEYQFEQIKSQVFSQYRSSFYIDSLEQIKTELVAFKLFFQKTYGQEYSDYMMQDDNIKYLNNRFLFTHLQIQSSRNIKEHLTNQNNMLRQRNNQYKSQLQRTQEQLANIKTSLINGLFQEDKHKQ